MLTAFIASGYVAFAQPPAQPTPLDTLYSSIQAQEANFPLPNTTETITVATIDVSEKNSSEPVIQYAIPIYESGTHLVFVRHQPPCTPPHGPGHPIPFAAVVGNGPCEDGFNLPNVGGHLTVANVRHLNIAFAITGWSTSNTTLTIALGSQSPQNAAHGTNQIVFNDVTDTSAALTVTLNGGLTANGFPIPDPATGVLPLTIDWLTSGVGAITIPVLPVSMVFAPIVDAQQKNTASAAVGISSLNTATASFASQNSSTVPVDSTFQNVIDIEQAAGTIGPALQKIPNPYTQAIGAALTTIAGLLGSSTATQTNSSVVAAQNTLQVGASQTQSQTAQASQGGPGVGDLITYYYNARVVWYADGQAMHLAVLGLDGSVQINAGKLAAAWVALQSQPEGTIDPVSHLDVDSLHSLLLLDPFFNGTQGANPTAPLAAPRFVPVSNHVVEIAGGQLTEQFTHQFSTTDLRTTQTTQVNSQIDKAGFLSFLGIGVTDSNTIQTSISSPWQKCGNS